MAKSLAFQKTMQGRGGDEPEERRFRLRIGINPGDVIAEGRDSPADGVNVVARPRRWPDPDSICVANECPILAAPVTVEIMRWSPIGQA